MRLNVNDSAVLDDDNWELFSPQIDAPPGGDGQAGLCCALLCYMRQ